MVYLKAVGLSWSPGFSRSSSRPAKAGTPTHQSWVDGLVGWAEALRGPPCTCNCAVGLEDSAHPTDSRQIETLPKDEFPADRRFLQAGYSAQFDSMQLDDGFASFVFVPFK